MSAQRLHDVETMFDSMNDLEKLITAKKLIQLNLTEWPGTLIGFRALIACGGHVDLASEWICRVGSHESKLLSRYEYEGERRNSKERNMLFEVGEFTDAFKLIELGIPGRLICQSITIRVESLPEGMPFGKIVSIAKMSVLGENGYILLGDRATEKGYVAAELIATSSDCLPIRIDLAHVFSEEEKKNPKNKTQLHTFEAEFNFKYLYLDENRSSDPFRLKGGLGQLKGVSHVKG